MKWYSDEGLQFPAWEKVSLENNTDKTITNPSAEGTLYHKEQVEPGQPYIYEGPDRAALAYLKEKGLEEQGYIGTHFSQHPDMIRLARERHHESVTAMVEASGYDKAKAKEIVEKQKKKVNTHSPAPKAPALRIPGGGTDKSGTGKPMFGAIDTAPTL